MTENATPVGLGDGAAGESFDDLLPGEHETNRCADFARSIAIDPAGTAIRADRVVLIETPLPWPKPVFAHQMLAPVDGLFKSAATLTRVLACVPERGASVTSPAKLWVFDRLEHQGVASTRERVYEVDDDAGLLDLSQELCAETTQDPGATNGLKIDRVLKQPTVLICTQGSHDICCGADGQRLAQELQAADPGIRVFSVSHTGGHRFAPTAMTLPDGRMWAYLGAELWLSILDGSAEPTTAAQYCRGWWGAGRGPEQVAERAVLAELGWKVNTTVRTVEPTATGALVTVETQLGHQRFDVEVAEARRVPTISCRAPGGQPVKEAIEYAATAVTVVG